METTVMSPTGFMQEFQLKPVVIIREEACLAVIATLGYVLGNIRKIKAYGSWHADHLVIEIASLPLKTRAWDRSVSYSCVRKCIRPLWLQKPHIERDDKLANVWLELRLNSLKNKQCQQ